MRGKGIDDAHLSINWADLMKHKHGFTDPVPQNMEDGLTGNGVTTLHGRARFTGPRQLEIDLIVIGAGMAGVAAANKCAAQGWRVAIVDALPYGGTCALRGCDPKKILRRGAEIRADHRKAAAARSDRCRLRRVGTKLSSPGRRCQAGMAIRAGREPTRSSSGGLDAG